MPSRRHASRIVEPSVTRTLCPSTVSSTRRFGAATETAVIGRFPTDDRVEGSWGNREVPPQGAVRYGYTDKPRSRGEHSEIHHRRFDRVRGRLAEAADRRISHDLRQVG